MRVLVTGASGYVGRLVVRALATAMPGRLVAVDVRPPSERLEGVTYAACDVRSPELRAHFAGIDSVVHLASIVTPGKAQSRAFAYAVDVEGTKNVLEGCVAAGVGQLVVTSSGAAYGYHADNPVPLVEEHPLRGNEAFAYAHHKRLVEQMLADFRARHPALRQLVFRPGTILGTAVKNQITDLFEKRVVFGIAGDASPFVFIWDEDVVRCIAKGVLERREGIFNLAGDGTLTMRQIAAMQNKPYLPVPASMLRAALSALRSVGLSQYGPEQVLFLQHRPVLSNERLKRDFGYVPARTSAEAFRLYLAGREART